MVIDQGEQDVGIEVLGGRVAGATRAASKALFRLGTEPRYYFRDQRYDRPGAARVLPIASEVAPDAIVCHAITNFLSFRSVARLAEASGARVLWSLMDMASFTGGCHYAWDCDGYRRSCGLCPALRVRSPNDWSARTLAEKRAALAGTRSTVVAASGWLAEQARSSALFADTPIAIVPLSVSQTLFKPRDRAALFAKLGLAANRPVLMFGARDLHDARKGMGVLQEALTRMAARTPADRLPTLLMAGDGRSFQSLASLGYPIHQLGLVGLEVLAEAYATADVFVSPSLEDSGPMMVNQAVMSGTPVVAFPIGVAPDLVEQEATGAFASYGDAASLAETIDAVLDWGVERAMAARERARETGLARCSPQAQARAFAALAMGEET